MGKENLYQKAYAVKLKGGNLYSTGGANPKFNKKGKRWSTLSGFMSHLSLLGIKTLEKYRKECELITYIIYPQEDGEELGMFIDRSLFLREERERKEREHRKKYAIWRKNEPRI